MNEFEKIAEQAFYDELEKIAAFNPGKAKEILKRYGKRLTQSGKHTPLKPVPFKGVAEKEMAKFYR